MRATRRPLVMLVAVVALFPLVGRLGEGAARAQRVVVADLYAETDIRAEAAALSLLLRSSLMLEGQPAVSRQELVAAIRRAAPTAAAGSGAARAPMLVLDPSWSSRVLAELGASFLVSGTVVRQGSRLVARVRVSDSIGATLGSLASRSTEGDIPALVKELATRIATLTKGSQSVPAVSTGQLRPLAEAHLAELGNDWARAGRALANADAEALGKLADGGALSESIVLQASAPAEARLSAAVAHGDAAGLTAAASSVLAQDRKSADGHAARALALLAAKDVAGATKELQGLSGAKTPLTGLARASVAHAAGDIAARDAALGPLLDARYPPALRFVADLPPGALGAPLETAALAAAEALRREAPDLGAGLASEVALRALRGGAQDEAVLSAVDVDQLGAGEVAELERVLAEHPTSTSAPAARVSAALAARAGNTTRALAEVDRALKLAPNDVDTQLLRGRLLMDAGDAQGAKDAFAVAAAFGGADAQREYARSLVAAGELDAAQRIFRDLSSDKTSVESAVAVGQILLANGDPVGGMAELEAARALASDSIPVLRAVADAKSKAGSTDESSKLLALADELDDSMIVDAAGARVVGGGGGAPGRGGERVLDTNGVADDPDGALATIRALTPLLAKFSALKLRQVGRLWIAPLAGSGAGPTAWLRPRTVRSVALQAALEKTAGTPKLGATIVHPSDALSASSTAAFAEPLSRVALGAAAANGRADAILLYQVVGSGIGDVTLRLILFDVATQQAREVTEKLAAQSTRLVVWSPIFVVAVLAALGLVVGKGVHIAVRGTGELTLVIKHDTAVDKERYIALVNHRSKAPDVADPASFIAKLDKDGTQRGRRRVTMAHGTVKFPAIPAGRWHVHLIGTFEKGGITKTLPDSLSRSVRVKRGQSAVVELNLIPTVTDYWVAVYDGEQPVVGATLWMDEVELSKVFTGRDGKVLIQVPMGSHVLHLSAKELKLSKAIEVTDTKIHQLTYNLARERARADVAGGIALDSSIGQPPASDENIRYDQIHGPLAGPLGANPFLPPPGSGGLDRSGGLAPGGGAGRSKKSGSGGPVGLERYQPVAELGRGAMGVVYKARDVVLERDVALKVISEEVRQIPVALEMFFQEAKVLATLNHPNVVSVFDQGQDGEHPFLVMELVDGPTLEKLLETQGRLGLPQTLELIDQLCAGLGYAHSRGVIHRDIKPANIFVASQIGSKLGDFGLARVVRELRIAQTQVRGTPLYMAPEQIQGADIDGRTDLYAVGCTLFELLTGRPPFVDGEILYHHMYTPPPRPTEFSPEIPPDLEAVVMSCIAKAKGERPATAELLRRALKPVLHRLGAA